MLAALALAFAGPLLLAEGARADDLAAQAKELRDQIRALETLRRAGPTAGQAAWMLHAARFLARDRAELEARRTAVLAEQREAFRRFLEEDERDRGFTTEVERAAAKASARQKDLEEAYALRLARITNAVREVLTPEQQDAVEGRRERRGLDPNRPPGTAEDVMSLLLRVRALPEADYRRREGQLAAFALRSPGVRKDATRDEVAEALRGFRAASEEELPCLRDAIVEGIFPGVRARELQKQLEVLRRKEDEPPGALGQFLESRVAVPALESFLRRLREGKAGTGPPEEDGPSPAPPGPGERKERKGREGEGKP